MRPPKFKTLFSNNDTSQEAMCWQRGLTYEDAGDRTGSLTGKRENYERAIREYAKMAYYRPEILGSTGRPERVLRWPDTEWAWPGYLEFLRHGDDLMRRRAAEKLGRLWRKAGPGSLAAHLFDSVAYAEREERYSSEREGTPPMPQRVEEEAARSARNALGPALRKIKGSPEHPMGPEAVENVARKRLRRYEYENAKVTVTYEPNWELHSEAGLGDTELIARLFSADVMVRVRAACILGVKGARTWNVYRALESLLSYKADRAVRDSALWALGRIASVKPGGFRCDLLPKLRRLIRGDQSYLVRQTAARFLGDIGTHCPDTAPVLAETLQRGDHEQVMIAAIEALGKCGPVARDALDLVRHWAPGGDDPSASLIKCEALLRITPTDPVVVEQLLPEVVSYLHGEYTSPSEEDRLRLIAVRALSGIPCEGASVKMQLALPLARSMWMDWSIRVRGAARRALQRLDLAKAARLPGARTTMLRAVIESIPPLREKIAAGLWERAKAQWTEEEGSKGAIQKFNLAVGFMV